MTAYLLIVALILFIVTLWYFSTCFVYLNTWCAALEIKLEVYRYRQKLGLLQDAWEGKYQELVRFGERSLRSQRSKISGKILEQYCPFAPEYVYDPDDSVAVFDVFDYIVFKGKSVNAIEEIIIQEMKSSISARLSLRQRQIRDCVQAGKVRFEMWRLDRATGEWHLYIPKNK